MRASLRGFYSSDVDLAAWRPDDGENFSIGVTASSARATRAGRRCSTSTCAPHAGVEHPPEKNFDFVRSTLLMQRWDYQTLQRALEDLCLRTAGADWNEVARRLSRYGHWEFEDYRA